MTKFFTVLLGTCLACFCAQAQIRSVSITAGGVTCSLCSKAIYKALTRLPSVKSVTADIQHSSYQINFRENVNVDPDQLRKAVEDAGFSVASMQLKAVFDHMEIEDRSHATIANLNLEFINVKKQLLNGEKTIVLVDKNFLPGIAFARYRPFMNANNGSMHEPSRIYHVTLL